MSAAIQQAYVALVAERDRLDSALAALKPFVDVVIPSSSAEISPNSTVPAVPPTPGKKPAKPAAKRETPDSTPKRGRLSNEEKAKIAQLHRRGESDDGIAEELDRPLATIQTVITTMQGEGVL